MDPQQILLDWLKRHDEKDDATFEDIRRILGVCQDCQKKQDKKINALLAAFVVLAVVNGGTTIVTYWPAIATALKLWLG